MQKEKEYKECVDIFRLRRITGYLVSDLRSFNNAKKAEVMDRTKNVGRVGFKSDAELKI